jgi:glycosyltransferase involved in cell wall biosynthesis
MLVSIIVTTKNEEKNIKNCLESISRQSFRAGEMEIIVVDNGSKDKTREISLEYTDKVFNWGPERSAQRNFGAGKAQGKYVLYLDADMAISPDLIEECVKKLENDQNLIALYVPEIIYGKSFWNKVRNFERSFYNGTVIDAVRFVRKDSFKKVGGFDENLTNNPLYHNETGFDLKRYIDKKSYYAKGFKTYIERWGKNDQDIKKQFGIRYRYVGVFVEWGKWKKLLSHPILTSGIYFLRILVGINYLAIKDK